MITQNLAAERALLGSILIESKTIQKVMGLVSAADFHEKLHQEIFQAAADVFSSGLQPDKLSILNKLPHVRSQYLDELADEVLTATHAPTYAQVVREKAELRKLSSVGRKIDAEIENGASPGEIIPVVFESLLSGYSTGSEMDSPNLEEIFERHVARMKEIQEKSKSGEFLGIPTGLSKLDEKVSICTGQLVLLAARPSVGKSAMALNIAEAAARYGKKVVYFSIEMDQHELMDRLLAGVSRLSSTRFKYGNVDEQMLLHCKAELQSFKDNLKIYSCPGITSGEVLIMCEAERVRSGVDLVIIDHMDLLRDTSGARGENEATAIGRITAALKIYARKNNVAVLALSQFNRESKGGMPELHQLRGSGAKEQDADIVMILHRPDMIEDPEEAFLVLRKNRNGGLGQIRLRFIPDLTRFEEVEAPKKKEEKMPKKMIEQDWDELFS